MSTITANQHVVSETSAPFRGAASAENTTPSKAQRWTGRTFTGLAAAFLCLDALVKLLMIQPVVESSVRLGYAPHTMYGIGTTLFVCTLLYVIPRTAVLGAVLLTGYLGGAVATHVRVDDPLFSHSLFPIYLGVLIWGGLFLRDARLRPFLPWRHPA